MTNPLGDGFLREQQLAFALYKAGERIRSELDTALSNCFAVNFLQFSLMLVVATCVEQTPAKIARRLRVDPAVVTRALDKLEALDLVDRKRTSTDRRIVLISLTESGAKVFDDLCQAAGTVLTSRLSNFTEGQAGQLDNLLALFTA
ncbi:MarR family winged helix-turn-helix transcriptional regulator [Paraburkholderia sp. BL25I1N1]|uniref:MarR family winged helix-turn-helix transcriptional regulator n=1 Tax=Paraburkholderia sp. BL25I1N1 TaxID=1938804 RepID=UPI000D04B45F|nr:MarR family transcriptional regulator [Paraburkholderia sp. BL25I1N1]PRY05993.1 DNA-binding MarR family transcriptional regulator [Paraburkholderia sp. BL25I1N1]